MKLEKKDFEFLPEMIENTIEKYFNNSTNKEFEKKIFNIQQTANEIGKSYNFVVSLMKKGYLKTTKDGKHITGKEINNYLGFVDNKKAVSDSKFEAV